MIALIIAAGLIGGKAPDPKPLTITCVGGCAATSGCDPSACTQTPDRIRAISDLIGSVSASRQAYGALLLDAPPCGTPEAKEWRMCSQWTIRPGAEKWK